HLQSPRRPHRGREGEGRRGLPPADRSGHPVRREVLPDLPPLGHPQAGGDLLPAVRRIPSPEEEVRSRGAVPERLVPPLPGNVRGRALRASADVPGADEMGAAVSWAAQGMTWTVPNWRKWWSNAKAFEIWSFSIMTFEVQSVKLHSLSE